MVAQQDTLYSTGCTTSYILERGRRRRGDDDDDGQRGDDEEEATGRNLMANFMNHDDVRLAGQLIFPSRCYIMTFLARNLESGISRMVRKSRKRRIQRC